MPHYVVFFHLTHQGLDHLRGSPDRVDARVGRGEGEITLLNVKPAVGFTLPSAGVTPAPSDKRKMRDFVPVRSC